MQVLPPTIFKEYFEPKTVPLSSPKSVSLWFYLFRNCINVLFIYFGYHTIVVDP